MDNLNFFFSLIYNTKNIYYWHFDADGSLLDTNCETDVFSKIFLKENLLSLSASRTKPIVFTDSSGLSWISNSFFNKEKLESVYVIGPVCFNESSFLDAERTSRNYSLSENEKESFIKVSDKIPSLPMVQFFQYGIMLHFSITGKTITASDLHHPVKVINITEAENSNEDIMGMDSIYHAENELFTSIENGDMNHLKIHDNLVSVGSASLGKLSSVPLRQAKDQVIVLIALATRSAIRGGLSPELAYAISDSYIQSVESSNYIGELAEISYAVEDNFVRRVHKIKVNAKLSPPILKCLDYIELHYNEKLTLKTFAELTSYSKDYIEKKFQNEMDISISSYIELFRINKAKELLDNSAIPLSQIAQKCGFSGQSYFGVLFKKHTKMTPKEYYDKNHH